MHPVLEHAPVARKEKKLLDQICDVMRLKHYSIRTERSYYDWVKRFISWFLVPKLHLGTRSASEVALLPRLGRSAAIARSWGWITGDEEKNAAEHSQSATWERGLGNPRNDTPTPDLAAVFFLDSSGGIA